jgi:hypothetical protein
MPQWGHGRDGTECRQVAFEVVNDPGGGFLDALFHDLATVPGVGEAGGKDFTQRRIGAQFLEFLGAQLFVLDPAPDLTQQMRWRDATGAQRPEALNDDSDGGNGTQNDR